MEIYKQIFLEAFNVVKKHKNLWLLGFFAILFSGSIEGDLYYGFLNNKSNPIYDVMQISSTGIFSKDILLNLQDSVLGNISSSFVLFVVFFVLITSLVVVLLISIGSQMIVISRAGEMMKNPKTPVIKLRELIPSGLKTIKTNLFTASLVNVLFKVMVFLIFALIMLPIFLTAGTPSVIADFWYLLLFVLLMPLTIILSLFVKYIVIGLVINKLKLRLAISNAWSIITKNWLISIETSFLLFLFNIVAIFFMLILISGLAIPLYYIAVLVQQLISPQFFVITLVLTYVILFIVFLLCNAIISTFSISVWTSLYLKLTKNNLNTTIKGFIGGIIR